jgi:hypothetical protein
MLGPRKWLCVQLKSTGERSATICESATFSPSHFGDALRILGLFPSGCIDCCIFLLLGQRPIRAVVSGLETYGGCGQSLAVIARSKEF